MSGNKTRPTDASIDAYLASRPYEQQAADCRALMTLFTRITGHPSRMWGPSIVGHGTYRYAYESGRTGEAPLAAFAVRGRKLVVYLDCEESTRGLLSRLGKHTMSKSCLYFKRLSDLDIQVLERLVANSITTVERLYD